MAEKKEKKEIYWFGLASSLMGFIFMTPYLLRLEGGFNILSGIGLVYIGVLALIAYTRINVVVQIKKLEKE